MSLSVVLFNSRWMYCSAVCTPDLLLLRLVNDDDNNDRISAMQRLYYFKVDWYISLVISKQSNVIKSKVSPWSYDDDDCS